MSRHPIKFIETNSYHPHVKICRAMPWGRDAQRAPGRLLTLDRNTWLESPSVSWSVSGFSLYILPPDLWMKPMPRALRRFFTEVVLHCGIDITLEELAAKSNADLLSILHVGEQTVGMYREWDHARLLPEEATS